MQNVPSLVQRESLGISQSSMILCKAELLGGHVPPVPTPMLIAGHCKLIVPEQIPDDSTRLEEYS